MIVCSVILTIHHALSEKEDEISSIEIIINIRQILLAEKIRISFLFFF